MTPREVLDVVAPPRNVQGLTLRDARGLRSVKQADLKGALRLPRGGPHRAELVASYRHYDGATGGQPGYYANVFVTWRAGTRTYRTQGVRVLPFEAERIARAVERGTGTRPGGNEPARIGGTGAETELRGEIVDHSGVLLFVKFTHQGGLPCRSRGVEILDGERTQIAEGLRAFAAQRGRAR